MAAVLMFGGCSYDDGDLWDKVNEIDDRLTTLEQAVSRMNGEIQAMDALVSALETGNLITGVSQTAAGYELTLNNGEKITINHGTNGRDGSNAPVIGVARYEEDGLYYWTITIDGSTNWLPGEGDDEMLRVTGEAGTAPVIGVNDDGYWTLDGEPIESAPGVYIQAAGQDGDSFFRDVIENETTVTIILADDTVIEIPKMIELKFDIDISPSRGTVPFLYGATKAFAVEANGVADYTIAKPDGWKAIHENGQLKVTAPEAGNTYADSEGEIAVLAVSRTGASLIAKVKVVANSTGYLPYTITFEGDYWNPLAAHVYKPNAISTGALDDGVYTWLDETSTLRTGRGYGGTGYPWIVSSYNSNNLSAYGTYMQDLYVYHPTNTNSTSGGGNGGSNNFITTFGYLDPAYPYYGDGRPIFTFDDGVARTVKSLYVNSTCYFMKEALDGSGMSPALGPGEEVTLHATGYDADDNVIDEVTMLFADENGVTNVWTEWDISALGEIVTLRINMTGGTDNGWGFSLPGYYAVDDITILLE